MEQEFMPEAARAECDTLPDDEILYDLAELFKVFGDTTRVKILYVLFESELCVNDIALRLTMTPSAVSLVRIFVRARRQ